MDTEKINKAPVQEWYTYFELFLLYLQKNRNYIISSLFNSVFVPVCLYV